MLPQKALKNLYFGGKWYWIIAPNVTWGRKEVKSKPKKCNALFELTLISDFRRRISAMILGGKKSTTKGGETAAAVALKLIIPKLFLNSSMTSSTLLYLLIRQSGRKINECLLIIKNTLINKLKKGTIYFAI